VVFSYYNQVRWDSPASSVDPLDNCSPATITWPYRFGPTTSLCASNNHVRVFPAHHEASFIKVVGVLIQDPVRSLYMLYKLKSAPNYFRILTLYSLLIVRLIETRSNALCTLYKVVWPALANWLSTTLSEQLIDHNSYRVKRGWKSSCSKVQDMVCIS
jgi:hypothetical protein